MRSHSLILAALVTLATGACRTTSTADASDAPEPVARAASDPTPSLSNPDDTLHDRVHDALMEKMGPRVNDVGITMHGTMVHLTGHVHSEADKKQAHDIAHGVNGVTAVDAGALAVKP